MGASTGSRTTLHVDRCLGLESRLATNTPDAGLLACREIDGEFDDVSE